MYSNNENIPINSIMHGYSPVLPRTNDTLAQMHDEVKRIELTKKRLSPPLNEKCYTEDMADNFIDYMNPEIGDFLKAFYGTSQIFISKEETKLDSCDKERIWLYAIGLGTYLLDPTAAQRQPAHYAKVFKGHEDIPLFLGALLGKILELNNKLHMVYDGLDMLLDDLELKLEIESKPDTENADRVETILSAIDKITKMSPAKQKKAKELIRKAKKEQEALQRDKTDYKNTQAQRETNLAQLQAEIERLRKANKELDSKNRKLEKELKQYTEPETVNEEPNIKPVEQKEKTATIDYSSVELPKKNVIFAGGHVVMTNKLNKLFPEWRFIATEDLNNIDGSHARPDCVFLWYGHISHTVFEKIRNEYGKDVIYLESTNIDRLVLEMKEKYAKAKGQLAV